MALTVKKDLKVILGIDPGLDGALVALSENRMILHRFVMPTGIYVKSDKSESRIIDIEKLNEIYLKLAPSVTHAYLEAVGSRPDQSAQSVFKFGCVYGITEALLVSSKIPYTKVSPQRWTKVMHEGIEPMEPKLRSKEALKLLFPHDRLLATDRSKVVHSGLMDALLIAEYGRRLLSTTP